MDINIPKIMMVGRVITEMGLETLAIGIFSKFLLEVVCNVSQTTSERLEGDLSKKLDHFVKSTFRSQAGVP